MKIQAYYSKTLPVSTKMMLSMFFIILVLRTQVKMMFVASLYPPKAS